LKEYELRNLAKVKNNIDLSDVMMIESEQREMSI
jgi:hypothetical protein